jgi:hypothetical protein
MARQTRTARDFANYRLSREIGAIRDAISEGKQGNRTVLDQYRQQIAFNAQHPRPPIQRTRKFKLLDNYDKVEADALQHLILQKKRDIRLLREAQTKQGAEAYIANRNLQDHLYVTDNDVDGDGVADIIVRQKQTDLPIIIDGYKTEKSKYPLRQAYYTDYPTRESRRGKSINDYLTQKLDAAYDTPTHRQFNEQNTGIAKRWASKGYADFVPRETISIPTAFKVHMYKPIMKSLKEVLKANNIPLSLNPQAAREIESAIRAQLITIPAMQAAFTEEVMNVTDDEWKRLNNKKEYKDEATRILINLIRNRDEYAEHILQSIVEKLVELKAMPDIDSTLSESITQAATLNMPRLTKDIDA